MDDHPQELVRRLCLYPGHHGRYAGMDKALGGTYPKLNLNSCCGRLSGPDLIKSNLQRNLLYARVSTNQSKSRSVFPELTFRP